MKNLITFCIGLLFVLTSPIPTQAHSLKSLETQLQKREKFFQPVAKKAPDFKLQDAGGRAVGSDDFRGKVIILNFVYTQCPDVCPLHAARIAEVQEMINQTPMRELVQFITVTTDPKNDTAEVMRDYGQAHGLDPVNWTFLTSGPGQLNKTRELVARFGHTFTQQGDAYQVHGVITHVIDMEGRWRANFHSLKFEPTNLVLFINALTNDIHGVKKPMDESFWQKIKTLFKP